MDANQYPQAPSDTKKTLSHDAVVWPLLILIPPVGIGLLWWGKKYTQTARVAITIGSGLLFVFYAVMAHLEGPSEPGSSQDSPTAPVKQKKWEDTKAGMAAQSKYLNALSCARAGVKKMRQALKDGDPSAIDLERKVLGCATKAGKIKPDEKEPDQLYREARELKRKIEDKTTPSKMERKLYQAFWSRWHKIHDSKNRRAILRLATPKGEKALAGQVARKHRVTISALDAALLKVEAQDRRRGTALAQAVRGELTMLRSTVESVSCQPSQGRMSLSIKLRALTGWDEASMKATIKVDLSKAVRICAARTLIEVVQVWVVAPLAGGRTAKVASITLDKKKHCKGSSCKLSPWYGPALQ
jgi:hypothetical protein